MPDEHVATPQTLVLTDVVDSTKLAATLGDEANAALWDRHDAVARQLVADWNGTEVERTDGILVLFTDPEQALGFAIAYQKALGELQPPLPARVGIHSGTVVVRPNPEEHVSRGAKPLEADGLSLSLAARVMSIALPVQILATREVLTHKLGEVTSHGHWRMKGASDPVEVFEVRHDQAPLSPPPDAEKAYRVVRKGDHWLPVREIPHALPAEWDRFVGRRQDLYHLETLLDDGARLVSITGIGGTGKTRLVTHYSWARLGDYPGGIWFCDLSEARDAEGILYAVAVALDVPLAEEDPIRQLADAIAGRDRCLMVLDNFEQVANHARDTVGRWLSRAGNATLVVTSREILGLPGEVALELQPLDERDSLSLFETRASAVARDFSVVDANENDVLALVRLLDHLPLAIELAAARVRVLSPRDLLARMEERFQLLRSTTARVDRQATLRATLDWSWDLLSHEDRITLATVSLFEGGFSIDAAEAVLSPGELTTPDRLQSLVDKSLVRQAVDGRLDLLVNVRTYAAEKLDGLGLRADAEQRHGDYFARLGHPDALEALRAPDGPERMRALERDLDNVVAACRRAVARADAEVALPTLKAAWAVLDQRGPVALAAALAEEVGDLPGLTPGLRDRLRAEALLARGSHVEGQVELRQAVRRLGYPEPRTLPGFAFETLRGVLTQVARRNGWARRALPDSVDVEVRMSATRAYQRLVETYWFACEPPRMMGSAISALNLCEPMGASPELARAYATLALATSGLRFDRLAERYASLASTTARGTGSPHAEAYVRFLATVYRIGHARWEEVAHDLQLSQQLFEQTSDHRLLGDARTVEGMSALYRGVFPEASGHFERVLETGRVQGNRQHQVWGALGDAEAQLRLGHVEVASERMAEALRVLDWFPSPMERARATGLAARIELAEGHRDEARTTALDAVQRLKRLGPPTSHYLLEGYAGAAEVLLELGASPRRAIALMRRYAGTFPIGEPRLAWLVARQHVARQRIGAARTALQGGLERAQALSMAYEAERLGALLDAVARL
ncbi:MAG: adenylate/guanylate cyclase domain-containing protein [Myxococcales bacterium]|nr:adenylate/guanylate cyclase domain-containing protein [Myxococcales bacterium]